MCYNSKKGIIMTEQESNIFDNLIFNDKIKADHNIHLDTSTNSSAEAVYQQLWSDKN